jgi:CheY-specific phosphatase CheX
MIDHNRKESLNEIVSKVFEQTAFLFPEAADLSGGISFEDFELIHVYISFTGDAEGEVSMVLPFEMCRELSSNILGEDFPETEEREKAIDAVKEMLNIITGQLLTKLFGHKGLFNLSSPELKELNREEFFGSLEQKDYSCHLIEQYPVITTISIKAGVYEH